MRGRRVTRAPPQGEMHGKKTEANAENGEDLHGGSGPAPAARQR